MWETGNGDWAVHAFMDLAEGGDIRRLFSDAELLDLVGGEEEYERRMMKAHERRSTPRGAAGATTGGRRVSPLDEAGDSGGTGEAGPGSNDEVGRKLMSVGLRAYSCVPAQILLLRAASLLTPLMNGKILFYKMLKVSPRSFCPRVMGGNVGQNVVQDFILARCWSFDQMDNVGPTFRQNDVRQNVAEILRSRHKTDHCALNTERDEIVASWTILVSPRQQTSRRYGTGARLLRGKKTSGHGVLVRQGKRWFASAKSAMSAAGRAEGTTSQPALAR